MRKSKSMIQTTKAEVTIVQDAFEAAYSKWIEGHKRARKSTPERFRRIENGVGHAEKEFLRRVWWPAFGNLDGLHPEFETVDFQGLSKFIDLAYLRFPVRIGIEVDGYRVHVERLSRRDFCNQWVRQMNLFNAGWLIIRIGYDDILERPQLWQQLLQQMFGRFFGDGKLEEAKLDLREKEIIRYAMREGGLLRLSDACKILKSSYRPARKIINQLEQKGVLERTGRGSKRIHSWHLRLPDNQSYWWSLLG